MTPRHATEAPDRSGIDTMTDKETTMSLTPLRADRREIKTGEMIRKCLDTVVRADGGDSRRITFTISTGAVDRERDVIDPGGWRLDEYRKNPVVLFAHDYHALPIARAVEITATPEGLRATAEFMTADLNPMADTVFRMVKGGWLNATSVGMRPIRHAYNDERGGFDFLEQELLEFSVVPVPANQEALVEIRSAGIDLEPLHSWLDSVEEWRRGRSAVQRAPRPRGDGIVLTVHDDRSTTRGLTSCPGPYSAGGCPLTPTQAVEDCVARADNRCPMSQALPPKTFSGIVIDDAPTGDVDLTLATLIGKTVRDVIETEVTKAARAATTRLTGRID